MTTFIVFANGTNMGEYRAETQVGALDQYARDAGYTDYDDIVAQFSDDATAHRIDTPRLIRDAEEATGNLAQQDAYGDGVVLIGNKSFATYADLAEHIGRDISDFFA
ncbi:hypothetical protein X805_38710 [Sphaerotilus natans subsp. natans DSM 6575]|uniref:Uncharacterized protein n=1 Tax=Sphaerotilus natans subsp. natans DSM 6575 TaxID=1286631 RepID=A0A059KGF8_9BURK|nr:hypothetical protein [Sphaerotilus natans]KDB50537.1 hypothetical protein X805_38710 [Sphaerotilus natans subsp. natans DSM 6575]SIR67216.1 hypothetical protein SAMN05421778_11447 [Sphaerotilus natans]